MKDVSVVIVTYNSDEFIKDCVLSLLNNIKDVSFDIIIVDNNSTGNSVKELHEKFSEIIFVENDTNLGFGVANNIALKSLKSKYVFLLNPDTKILNNAVGLFFEFMEQEESTKIWCCGANILDGDFNPSNAFGKYTSVGKILFEQFGLNRILKKYFAKKFTPNHNYNNTSPMKVPFIVGADMFIRREVLNKIGLFDEDFDLNFEEAELSFRAFREGYSSVILPEAKIIHYGGRSFKNEEEQWFFYRKNEVLFAKKCFPISKYVLVRFIYVLGTLLRLLIKYDKYDFLLLKYLFNEKRGKLTNTKE